MGVDPKEARDPTRPGVTGTVKLLDGWSATLLTVLNEFCCDSKQPGTQPPMGKVNRAVRSQVSHTWHGFAWHGDTGVGGSSSSM